GAARTGDCAAEVAGHGCGGALARVEAQDQHRRWQAAELDRVRGEAVAEIVDAAAHPERRGGGRAGYLTLGVVDEVAQAGDRRAARAGVGHVRAEAAGVHGRAAVDVAVRRAAVAVGRVALVAGLLEGRGPLEDPAPPPRRL